MKKWHIKERSVTAKTLKVNPDINPVVLQLLANRGITSAHARQFLNPDYRAELHDPFLFKDMRAAVELIVKHITAGNTITVYGDYDADGITSTAVMVKTLEFVGAGLKPAPTINVYIPHRETEGYGLSVKAVEEIAKGGTKLIITVDGGIRSIKEVKCAHGLNLDVIVTDHHEPASVPPGGTTAGKPGEGLPDCLIINPKVKDDTYPFAGLAGVGVAFKVAQALLRPHPPAPSPKGRGEASVSERGEGVFEKWLLDLVAIGTIADLVPLVDENRALVKYGLVVLNKTKRVGLQKLMDVAQSGVDKNGPSRELDAWQVGFQLAPRLNAAGRLNHASNAYRLLVTEDEREATRIAQELNETNQQRQSLTEEIFTVADEHVSADDSIIFAAWPGLYPPHSGAGGEGVWPAGIMGLVAGKLTEKYYRPALAITQKKNGAGNIEIVGSARSIPEFDVTAMLEQCAELLANYGGHKQAAGFTIALTPARNVTRPKLRSCWRVAGGPALSPGEREPNLEKFLQKAKIIADEELQGKELTPTLEVDMEVNFNDISDELYAALAKLKPFGMANPQPRFVTKNTQVVNVTSMGSDGQHLKLRLLHTGNFFDAVAFGVPDEWKQITVGDKIDVVYYIDMNEWNGNKNLQLKIIDIAVCDTKS